MSLYNCKEIGGSWRITKFTNDLEVEASYFTNGRECDCPAGHRPVCRHRIMLPRFIAKNATAGQWFHNYEHQQWVRAAVDDEPYTGTTLGSMMISDDLANAASELTIASEITLPNDVTGEDVANAFAGLLHKQGEPKPINLLALAEPPNYEGAITGRFKSSDHIEEIDKQAKPLRRL